MTSQVYENASYGFSEVLYFILFNPFVLILLCIFVIFGFSYIASKMDKK